jgi:hypothetical protein
MHAGVIGPMLEVGLTKGGSLHPTIQVIDPFQQATFAPAVSNNE